jgi:hypothetical protein
MHTIGNPTISKLPGATVLIACALLGMNSAAAHDDWRVAFQAAASLTGKVILPDPGNPDYLPYADRCQGAPVQVIQGAGDSPLLGLFTDVQSHCLGSPLSDPQHPGKFVLPFFNGVFTFTNSSGHTIKGAYKGQLRQTDTSSPPPNPSTPPAGAWVVDGRVCVSGGSLFNDIVNDCTTGRYFDATGLTNLDPFTDNVNLTTLFLHQTIGLK